MGFMPSDFRPLLADIVQTEDIKELCKLLVVASGEAAKAYAGISRHYAYLTFCILSLCMAKYPGDPTCLHELFW
jgi:hypothetical protein